MTEPAVWPPTRYPNGACDTSDPVPTRTNPRGIGPLPASWTTSQCPGAQVRGSLPLSSLTQRERSSPAARSTLAPATLVSRKRAKAVGARPTTGVSCLRASRFRLRNPPVGCWSGTPPQTAATWRSGAGSEAIPRAIVRSETVNAAASTVASSAAPAAAPRATSAARPRRLHTRRSASRRGVEARVNEDTSVI